MTIDEAIVALTEAREKVGSDAPLLMADGLDVVSLPIGEGAVYVCDLPEDEDEGDDFELIPDPKGRTRGERDWIASQVIDAMNKVCWDNDTGTCGVWGVNVAGMGPDQLTVDLFNHRNGASFETSYANTAELRQALKGHRAMHTCFGCEDIGDLAALLESTLNRYTGTNCRQPIFAGT
jgi:hypothetical protein